MGMVVKCLVVLKCIHISYLVFKTMVSNLTCFDPYPSYGGNSRFEVGGLRGQLLISSHREVAPKVLKHADILESQKRNILGATKHCKMTRYFFNDYIFNEYFRANLGKKYVILLPWNPGNNPNHLLLVVEDMFFHVFFPESQFHPK